MTMTTTTSDGLPRPSDPFTLPAAPRSRRYTLIMTLVMCSLMMALGFGFYAVHSVAGDRDGWKAVAEQAQQQNDELRAQVAEQSTVQACRSQANFKTVSSTGRVIQLISKLIVASDDPAQVAAIRLLLPPASQALDDAIAAQDAAIPDSPGGTSTCNPTPP